jgi:hypothetical protein
MNGAEYARTIGAPTVTATMLLEAWMPMGGLRNE